MPVVQTDRGRWLVELWASDPEAGGNIEVSSPSPADEGGFNGGVQATYDPLGVMASRTHLFVIAYVDGATISAVAGTFLVEG